jgi:hypothetical protein
MASTTQRDRDPDAGEFGWYYRPEPKGAWQVSACLAHGAQLVELGFQSGLEASYRDLGPAHQCAICNHTTTLDDVRACGGQERSRARPTLATRTRSSSKP